MYICRVIYVQVLTSKFDIMHTLQNFLGYMDFVWPYVLFLIIWDASMRLIALWKSGRNNDAVWFICIAIFNTLGILPLIYMLLKKKNTKNIQTV